MPFSLPRLLSKLQSVITIDTANNDLHIANAVVFSDGTRQTTAGVAVDSYARSTANGANGLAQGAFDKANTALYANNGVLTVDGLIVGGAGATQTYSTTNGDFTEGFFYIEPSQNHLSYNSGLFTTEANTAISTTPIGTVFHLTYTDNSTDTVTQTGTVTWFGAQGNITVSGFTAGSNKNIKSISWTSSGVQTVIDSTGVIVGNVNVLNYTQSAFDKANTASSNTVYLQTVNNNQNTSISILENVNTTQNTRIGSIETINNNQNTSISIIQGVDLTQNTRLDGIEGVNAIQNTNITLVNQFAQSAYAQANISIGVNATQNTRLDSIETINTNQNTSISIIESVNVTQNTRLDGIEGVNLSQNTTITEVNQFTQAAYNKANNSLPLAGGTVTGTILVGQDVYVSGNLYVSGNTTTVGANNITLSDSLIYLANENPANTVDIGIVGHFVQGKYQHTGVVRNHLDGNWIFFSNVSAEPTTTINFAEANLIYDSITVGGIKTPTATIGGLDFKAVNDTQNTNITAVNNYATGAYNLANTNASNITTIQSVNDTQNTRIQSIEVVNLNQNTSIGIIQGVDDTQNTQISLAQSTAQAAFDKANTGGSSAGLAGWTVVNSNYTVGNNVQLIANTTTAGFTVTLPASPVSGNTVVITDGSLVSVGWANNGVTVARNGSTILGYSENLVLNVSRSTATLVYDGTTWQVSSTVGPKGDTGATGPAGATGNTGPAGAGANATQRNYRFNATNNQTIFVGADAYSQSLSYNVNAVSVYLNGVFLRPTDDYVANNGTTIYLTSGTFANDALDVVAFESMSLTAAQNTITTYVYTASNNQTSFGGADINAKVLDYNLGNIFVTLNGLTLRKGVDYLESNTSYIALTSGANANDEVSIVAFGSFSVQGQNTQNTISSYYYTSTAGQTDFTGSDIYGRTLSYMPNGLFVVRNGSTLRNNLDYTATNGTTVSLTTPAAANDEIAITAVGWFSVAANGYTQVEANNLFVNKTEANTSFVPRSQANSMFVPVTGGVVNGNLYLNSTIFTHGIIETANIITTPIGANTNFDIITQAVQYYTANAASNTTINIRGNSGTPLNSLMSVGNTTSVVLLFTNGANTYYPNVIQVDGNQVTPKWQSGTTVTAGNSNATDLYGFSIVKTADATFTVFASQTKFA